MDYCNRHRRYSLAPQVVRRDAGYEDDYYRSCLFCHDALGAGSGGRVEPIAQPPPPTLEAQLPPQPQPPKCLYYIRNTNKFAGDTYNFELEIKKSSPRTDYILLATRRPAWCDDKLNPFYAWNPGSGKAGEPLPNESRLLELPVPRDPEDVARPCAHNEKTLTYLVQCKRNGTDPGKFQFIPHFSKCDGCKNLFERFSKANAKPAGGIRTKYSDERIKAMQEGKRPPRGKAGKGGKVARVATKTTF